MANRSLNLIVILGAVLAIQTMARADTVLVERNEGTRPARVVGEILEWTGEALTVRHIGGREETIPAARVAGVEECWNEAHAAGLIASNQSDYIAALEKFQVAIRTEKRPWARRELVAQSIWCYRYLGQVDRAITAFLYVYRSDPTTHHFASIPLPWTTSQSPRDVMNRAERLIGDESPVARLIGAAWLLTTNRRSDAIRTLQALLNNSDARVVFLASAQLWRTQPTSDDEELDRWRSQVDAMPESLRAGPYMVLGDALGRAGNHQDAALVLMRIPILYPEFRDLAAQALLAAANELAKINRPEQARGLYREVVVEHADSDAATEARQRLGELKESGR